MKTYYNFVNDKLKLVIILCLLCGFVGLADARSQFAERRILFDSGWKFRPGDFPEASSTTFNDATWRNVWLPHDWSIEYTVDPKASAGNDGGYYPAGTGWYRKVFNLFRNARNKKTGLYFEGVYMNSQVYVNGQLAGGHPYGYSSFFVDITPYVKEGRNIVAVRVDNSRQKNCRWYSGSGIYRHVWMITTSPVHIAHQGVFISTQNVSGGKAVVRVKTTLCNETSGGRKVNLDLKILDKSRTKVANASVSAELPAGSSREVVRDITIERPELWDVDSPYLYSAALSVKEDGRTTDEVNQPFGVRTIAYSAEKGFLLNGRKIKLYGGCVHHDNGMLGAAAFDRAEERKVELMKAAGFNALRTSHNIPSEAFLDACDRLGMLVIDEAFDGWRDSKNKYDYSTLFDKWWKKDIESMVLRDRNHPSIFCWSIGNEVIERKKLEVVTTARKLAEHVKSLDDTRPVTSALASWDKDWEIYDPLAAVHDIAGYNYLLDKAPADHLRVPSRIIMQTESYPKDAFRNWKLVSDNNYIIGDFVWTAIDYLGESGIGRYYYEGETPGEHYQHNQYPWHGAYCGDIDITGWRKPISHYREMLFNANKKLYMAVREPDGYHGKIKTTLWSVWPTWESWNWQGHEGKDIQVEVYSRYPAVRLYQDGRLIGECPTDSVHQFKAVFTVKYKPGKLVAVGVESGQEKERTVLQTTGKPAIVQLTTTRKTLTADGEDLAFVTVEIKDKNGMTVPDADNEFTVSVNGAASLAAAGSADMTSTTGYTNRTQKTWKGRAMIVVRNNGKTGAAGLKVASPGLPVSELTLKAVK